MSSIATMKEGEVMGRGVKAPELPQLQPRVAGTAQGETIAILGAGPAGLLAAHACVLAGRDVAIISKPDSSGAPCKSNIAGATYLHTAIPDLTSPDPDGVVNFKKLGTARGYAKKLYGDHNWPTSWGKFEEGEHPAWHLQPAYDALWELYGDSVAPQEVTPETVPLLEEAFARVISTVPLPSICRRNPDNIPGSEEYAIIPEGTKTEPSHVFKGREIHITLNAWSGCPDDTIVYNGDEHDPWYRSSRIFGHEATEYLDPVPDSFPGIKPLGTTCNCHPYVTRAGRWGRWQPGVLVNHAFENTFRSLFL